MLSSKQIFQVQSSGIEKENANNNEQQSIKSNNHDNKREIEMKNKISEGKTSLEEIKSRSKMTEESVNLLKTC